MPEQRIEDFIDEVLTGESQKTALEFAAFLRANEMLFVRGKGYWEDKLYWMIKYKDEYVCFILIDGSGSEEESALWTIWSDDSASNWFEDFPLDEHTKEMFGKMLTSAEIAAVATIRGEAAKLYSERNLITSVALL